MIPIFWRASALREVRESGIPLDIITAELQSAYREREALLVRRGAIISASLALDAICDDEDPAARVKELSYGLTIARSAHGDHEHVTVIRLHGPCLRALSLEVSA